MGNVVTGSYGGLVYANSTNGALSLNTATIGPVGRPNNFSDQAAQNLAQSIPLAVGGQSGSLVRLSMAGFGLGAGFDLGGQYFLNGEVRPVQSIVAGLTGAAGFSLASRGGLWGPIAGAGVATTNTVFNNYYYQANTNLWAAAGLGAFAGFAGPLATNLIGRSTGSISPNIPMFGSTPNFSSQVNLSKTPTYIGEGIGAFIGNANNFIPLNDGTKKAK